MSSSPAIKDLTQGNITKQLWSLAWPTMLSMFFYTLYSIVDMFWVSKLSMDSIAAVSISQVALFVMISLSMGMAVGSSVVMGMHIGAKEKKEAERVLGQSFVIATLFAIFFTVISLIFREWILTTSGAIGSIYEPSFAYFTITAAGSILFFYLINIIFAFNSEGDTFTLTKLFAFSTFINIFLDPLLIFGKWGFPELGIEGAAYATLVSQVAFVVVSLFVLSRPSRGIRFAFSNISFCWKSVKRILDIGIPASLTQVINPIASALLISLVSTKFLEPGATAFSLVFRLEFFAYLPAIGFGMAAMAIIGQSMGAGNSSRPLKVFKKAALLGFLSATGLGLGLILAGRFIVGVFTDTPLVTQYSLSYLFIVAGTYGFLATVMVIANTFQAMGRSWPGFWIFLAKYFVIAIPISYTATKIYDGPIWSVWIAIGLSNVLMAIAGYFWLIKSLQKKSA